MQKIHIIFFNIFCCIPFSLFHSNSNFIHFSYLILSTGKNSSNICQFVSHFFCLKMHKISINFLKYFSIFLLTYIHFYKYISVSTKFIIQFETIARLENHLSGWQGLGIYAQRFVVIQGLTGRPTGTGMLYPVIHNHPGTMDEAPGDQEAALSDSHPATCSHIRSLNKPMGNGSCFLVNQSHLITHF